MPKQRPGHPATAFVHARRDVRAIVLPAGWLLPGLALVLLLKFGAGL